MSVSFGVPKTAIPFIVAIVKRYNEIRLGLGAAPVEVYSAHMDLMAAHANGCPLDFAKLAGFDDFNLVHDVSGIQRHIDRDTGTLGGCFLPRCALPETVEA